MFSFQNKNSKFDRVFSIFFFKSMIIDILTNCELNPDLQLPTYQKDYKSIKEKLTKKELKLAIEFVNKYRGKITDKFEAEKILQNHFNLSDCDISM